MIESFYPQSQANLRKAIWDWANESHDLLLLDGEIDDLIAKIESAGWRIIENDTNKD